MSEIGGVALPLNGQRIARTPLLPMRFLTFISADQIRDEKFYLILFGKKVKILLFLEKAQQELKKEKGK